MKQIPFFILVMIAMLSCTPKSAMMTKAIILDGYDDIEVVENKYLYKVSVPAYGIVESHTDWRLYERGDTILIHDRWSKYQIK